MLALNIPVAAPQGEETIAAVCKVHAARPGAHAEAYAVEEEPLARSFLQHCSSRVPANAVFTEANDECAHAQR